MRRLTQLVTSAGLCAGLLIGGVSCGKRDASDTRVFMLGFDGMDPVLLVEMMDAGRMPNFAKLARQGSFSPLGTSTPPQSPVAWSNVITGCDAAVHGIYDFIHRDPKPAEKMLGVMPYLSTSKAGEPGKTFDLGKWRLPLSSGEGQLLLRQGTPFWDYITEAGHPAVVYRMPSQFPPPTSKGAELIAMTGMGTPDLMGSYGEFTLFSTNPTVQDKKLSGGKQRRMFMTTADRAEGEIIGPPNHMLAREDPEEMEIQFTVDRDAEDPVCRISIQEQNIVLGVGDWSDWVQLEFDTGFPGTGVSTICRFRLNEVRPYIELYMTPLDIDPTKPFQPITEPADFAAELAEAGGLFYTQGIPEDHASLSEGALDDEGYQQQIEFVMDERMRHLDYMLKRYKGGLFYFYFGTTDQVAHMYWRDLDPEHPMYTEELAAKYGDVVKKVYERADAALGRVMQDVGKDDLLLVMSDHGFNSFSRGFNLNTWLKDNGYITLKGQFPQDAFELFLDVDWSQSKAYNLGINCLYLNLSGREKYGIVKPGPESDELMDELVTRLKEVKDPDTGEQVIAEVYRTDRIYPGADSDIAPDLLVGYARGYRASWGTILGKMPYEWLEDNEDRWSGDHCVATHLVPGVILSNRKSDVKDPTLLDLAPSILAAFDIPQPKQMNGRNLY